MASKEIKGLNLSISLDNSEFKATLNELKRDVNMASDNVKAFQRVLKDNPKDPVAFDALKTALKNLSTVATNAKEKLKEVFDDAVSSGWSTSDSRMKSLITSMNQIDNILKQLHPDLEEVNDNFEVTAKNIEATDIAVGDLISSAVKFALNSVKNVLSEIWSLTKSAINGIYELVTTGYEYNSSIQTYSASINAILGGTEDAQVATKKLIESMKSIAKQSSFSSDALLDSVTQLIASGVSADDAAEQVTALAKALAYAGKSDDELKRMAQNLNQIQNAGKATAADLKQFAYAGVPIYKLLADYSEKFANGVDANTNPATYEDIAAAILKASEANGQFYEAFTIQAGTISGQMTKLESNWTEFLGTLTTDTTNVISQEILPAINDTLVELQKAYKYAQMDFDEVGKTFDTSQIGSKTGMDYFYGVLAEDVEKITKLVTDKDLLENITNIVTIFINALKTAFDPNTEQGAKNREALYELIDTIIDFVVDLCTDTHIVEAVKNAITTIIKAFAQSIANQQVGTTTGHEFVRNSLGSIMSMDYILAYLIDSLTKLGNIFNSGGFGDLQGQYMNSGGFASGGIVLNTNFTLNNTSMDDFTANRFARVMANKINEELGRMV